MPKQPLIALTLIAALTGASPLALAQTASHAHHASAAASAASAAPAAVTPATVLVSGPAGAVTAGDLEELVNQSVPPSQRSLFWAQPDTVKRWAQNLYDQQALAQGAIKEGLDRTPDAVVKLKLARAQVLAGLLVDARVQANAPDDKALRAYARGEIKANPDRYQTPEQIDARHILLPVAPNGSDDAAVKAQAQSLLAQLRKGADFATLAKANSKDPGSAARGGDLGFFARGRMVAPFEQAAFGLKKPGDLAGPVRTQFGYHIIQLVARKPASQQTIDEVLPQLREQLIAKRSGEARQALLGQIQDASQLDQAHLDALVAQQAAKNPLQQPATTPAPQ